MNKTDNPAEVGMHKFERAGLGKAPFRFVGYFEKKYVACPGAPVQPGGTCDFCGTAITGCFSIKSADGKLSIVGCNCIEKVGDTGILRAYRSTPEYRKAQAEKRRAKDVAVSLELDAIFAANKEAWTALPHPRGFLDFKTGLPLTKWDSEVWYRNQCGAAGRARLLRSLKGVQ